MITNVYWSSCKVSFILFRNSYFLESFSINTQTLNFMKIRPVGFELFHADRQTDRRTDGQTDAMKLIVAFRKFANAPKTGIFVAAVTDLRSQAWNSNVTSHTAV